MRVESTRLQHEELKATLLVAAPCGVFRRLATCSRLQYYGEVHFHLLLLYEVVGMSAFDKRSSSWLPIPHVAFCRKSVRVRGHGVVRRCGSQGKESHTREILLTVLCKGSSRTWDSPCSWM